MVRSDQARGLPVLPAITASLLIFLFALYQGLATRNGRDFFIFRLGAELALRGENPYDLKKIRQNVAEEYPGDDRDTSEFAANCGYFLPPLALVYFIPLAAMPAIAAKICWALAAGIAGFFVARIPGLFRSSHSPPSVIAGTIVPLLLVLNPMTLAVVLVGQASFLSLGCVAAGLLCLERGRSFLAAILWVLPFLKPHVGIALLPLLWFLAGWRPVGLLLVLVLLFNLIGATVVGGSPGFIFEYLNFLSDSHKTVGFNRIASNPTITSWNCLLYRAGGPLIELTIVTTLAGYLVWFGLAVGRVAISGTRPSASWALAVTATGAVLCSQVLRYELLILSLLVPWVRDLLASGHRVRGWLAIVLMALQLVPGISFPPSLAVMLLAMVVLMKPDEGQPHLAIESREADSCPGTNV